MEAVLAESGARLVLPNVSAADLINYAGQAHAILPNRFVAETDDASHAAAVAKQAFDMAWNGLAEEVYSHFVDRVAQHGAGSRTIWDRQIAAFWELTWVVGDDDALIDQRKNWRLPALTIEYGDRCSLMPPWQELSGYPSGQENGASAQKRFWMELARRLPSPLDLDRRERLCAIALIKRLFPLLDPRIQQDLLGVRLKTQSWPSTVDVATAPWKMSVAQNQNSGVVAARDALCLAADASRIEEVRGTFLIREALDSRDRTADLSPEKRAALSDALRTLQDLAKTRPSKHYAILLADGDQMGVALRAARIEGTLDDFTRGMVDFSANAPTIVDSYRGSCVYAGGDDVLALLPVPDALQCADKLATAFETTFGGRTQKPTLSVAVLFAHYRLPLSDALRSSHELLDVVAKEKTGRASLAIAVHKHSGPAAEFAAPWVWWRETRDNRSRIDQLSTLVASDAPISSSTLTRSYLYKVRGLLERLTLVGSVSAGREPGASYTLDPKLAAHVGDLLTAELLVGRGSASKEQRNSARVVAERLVDLSHPVRRTGTTTTIDSDALSFSPARIAMFLATGGAEET